jgi:hypothetical protein
MNVIIALWVMLATPVAEGRDREDHGFRGNLERQGGESSCASMILLIRFEGVFRDLLRTHDAVGALYERTKRELAQREWKYVQNYADAKAAIVEEILSRARRA